MISEMCYMLYQTDWKKQHGITTKKKAETIKDYLQFMNENGLDKDSYSIIYGTTSFRYGQRLWDSLLD